MKNEKIDRVNFDGKGFKISLKPNKKYPDLNAFTFGIDNMLWSNRFGIQFYDYDSKKPPSDLIMNTISYIFQDDLILYKTENGYHFISFEIINYKKTIENVDYLSKILIDQDYHALYNLTLRIAPKFLINDLSAYSIEPKFYMKKYNPSNLNYYSYYHLNYYRNYLGLPVHIFENYYKFKYYKPKFHIYRTRNKTKI